MKTTLYVMVFIVTVVIVVAVVVNTAPNPVKKNQVHNQSEMPCTLELETTSEGYWDRIKALNTTAPKKDEDGGEEESDMTDENGNTVTSVPEDSDTLQTSAPLQTKPNLTLNLD